MDVRQHGADRQMIRWLSRITDVTLALLRVSSGTLLLCSVGLNLANIIGRYFLHTSIPWAEEVMLLVAPGSVASDAASPAFMVRSAQS